MGLVNPFGINSSFESVYLFGGGGTNETAIPAEFRQDWDIPDDEGVNSIVIVPRNGVFDKLFHLILKFEKKFAFVC